MRDISEQSDIADSRVNRIVFKYLFAAVSSNDIEITT